MKLNFTNILIITLILLIGGIGYLYHQNRNLQAQVIQSNQNISYLTDSLRTAENKIGQLEYSKSIIIADKETIENYNKDLSDELSKAKGEIIALTQTVITSQENEETPGEITSSNTPNRFNFNFDTEFSSIEGYLTDTNDEYNIFLTKNEHTITITQGIRKKDNRLEVFAWSNTNGKITEMNSALFDPKDNPVLKSLLPKNRLHISVYSGYGVTYNPRTQTALDGFQLGVGASFTIF